MSCRKPTAVVVDGWIPFESGLRKQGYLSIAGVDEVGRGCLAGPVVAAAVVLPEGVRLPGVADSKKLSPERRETLFDDILLNASAVGVGRAEPQEIDQINILQATLLAMKRALDKLAPPADYILVDGNTSLPVAIPQRTIIKGDNLCLSIAAASIVAKVTRDRWMVELAIDYPQYFFERHKGYGTREHLDALVRFGPSPIHRRTFRGVLPDVEREKLNATFSAPQELLFPKSPARGKDR